MRFHLNINKIKDFIGSENKNMTSVFLWIPNIIGYFRFVFLFAVLFTYDCCPVTTIVLYAVSQLLDMFDGMAARHFNQCSNFGAVLDMVCDRASNAVMLAILGHLYPQYSWLFYGDIILDLVSHWYQMYSALSSGKHHKQIKNKFALLDIYYYNKLVLGGLVAGNEAFLLSSYLLAFSEQLQLSAGSYYFFFGLMVVSGLLFAVKKLMSVLQLIGSAMTIAERDAQTPQSDAKKS
jgi:CDP-diacylglycerol--inositol 3-phosphatidyltransferase